MTNYCSDHGLLIDPSIAIPTDPHLYWTGAPPSIPCSNLTCTRCKVVVRNVDGRRPVAANTTENLATLYADPAPQDSPLLVGGSWNVAVRMYFCLCEWKAFHGAVYLAVSDEPWTCAGHPDENGTSARRNLRIAEWFQAAMKDTPEAVVAWDALFAQEGAGGVAIYRELVDTTQSWRVRGRAAMAVGRLVNDYRDAKDRLGATIANSDDEVAKAEAARFLKEIPP